MGGFGASNGGSLFGGPAQGATGAAIPGSMFGGGASGSIGGLSGL